MTDEPRKKRVMRLTAIQWGLAVGFGAPVLTALGLMLWIGPTLYRPPFNAEVVSFGADVSGHGGAKVIVENEQGTVMAQACRDLCDDIRLLVSSGDNSFRVRVLTASGRPLTDSSDMYVTNGDGSSVTRWTVSGSNGLNTQLSFVRRKDNGTFEEHPFDTAGEVTPAAANASAP